MIQTNKIIDVHFYGFFITFIVLCVTTILVSCATKENTSPFINNTSEASTFFGDSTLTIVSINRPNGYLVKFFQSKDFTLLKLSKGENFNRYLAIHEIPYPVLMDGNLFDLTDGHKPDSIGTYYREINIPVNKELGPGLFFMDVNFDGIEELVIEYDGYNRYYYACFDLVNGKNALGILNPMDYEPYNNIVSWGGSDTEFDYSKKTIHIYEKMGSLSYEETWCEMTKDYEFDKETIKVVRKESVEYYAAGYKIITVYKRIDGELKKVSETKSLI